MKYLWRVVLFVPLMIVMNVTFVLFMSVKPSIFDNRFVDVFMNYCGGKMDLSL